MRTAVNYVVDTLLAILFLAIAFIGILMGFFIPKGEEAPGYEKVLWGLQRHAWGDLHLYFSLAFVALVIVHLALHWDWLKANASRRLPRSLIAWVVMVLIAAAAPIAIGARLTPPGAYGGAGLRHGQQQRGRGRAVEPEPLTNPGPAAAPSAAEDLD